jgi:hypothetical protein
VKKVPGSQSRDKFSLFQQLTVLKSLFARKLRVIAKLVLNTHQLVEFLNSLAAAAATCLQVTGVHSWE